jgi:hypothetical protein
MAWQVAGVRSGYSIALIWGMWVSYAQQTAAQHMQHAAFSTLSTHSVAFSTQHSALSIHSAFSTQRTQHSALSTQLSQVLCYIYNYADALLMLPVLLLHTMGLDSVEMRAAELHI